MVPLGLDVSVKTVRHSSISAGHVTSVGYILFRSCFFIIINCFSVQLY